MPRTLRETTANTLYHGWRQEKINNSAFITYVSSVITIISFTSMSKVTP